MVLRQRHRLGHVLVGTDFVSHPHGMFVCFEDCDERQGDSDVSKHQEVDTAEPARTAG